MNIIGLDVGGTKIRGICANEYGKFDAKKREEIDTEAKDGPDAVLDRIAGMIRNLTPPDGVAAIGVGSPGPIDPVRGISYNPPNLPGWKEVHLGDELRKRLDVPNNVPIKILNDVQAAALGEYKFGAGRGEISGEPITHMVYLTVSTGIGAGVIMDGKLLQGSRGWAGEMGHLIVDVDGPHCYCGGIGCLEILASGRALAREGSIVVASRRETSMAEAAHHNPDNVTGEIVSIAAQQGDTAALELMNRESLLIGVGIVNCIHAFNPQLIVLGGGVSEAGEILFKSVRMTVEARVMPAYKGSFDIVPAALKDKGGKSNSGVLGAVAFALQAIQ